ncbi:MAG TPA: hypothetical protein VFW94_23535 [Candidatus Acidoferrales bacterium]|nr:hypothetical protein [Candidatus Acidoferrales bacterium]
MGKTSMIDMAGHRHGRMTVIARADGPDKSCVYWECLCDCGTRKIVRGKDLRKGAIKSCGCYRDEATQWTTTRTHGHASKGQVTPTYRTWMNMRQRCTNPKNQDWEHYGGRGIRVCERWENFDNFLADMGKKPRGKSIDRRDTDGDYEPGNCLWATQREQCRNKRNNRVIEWRGQKRTMTEWAELSGRKHATQWLYRRLTKYTLDEAMAPLTAFIR